VLRARFLSLFVIVAALFVARVALSTDVPASDRAELPNGGDGGDDNGADGDNAGGDLTLPSHAISAAALRRPQRLVVEAERSPTTSAFAPSIFRPPISTLA